MKIFTPDDLSGLAFNVEPLKEYKAVDKVLPTSEVNISKFRKYAQPLSSDKGSRNHNSMRICREGLALGIPQELILSELERFVSNDFKIKEIKTVLKNQIRYHSKKPFTPFSKDIAFENENLEIAKEFMNSKVDEANGNNSFCTVGKNLHRYENGVYVNTDDEIFKIEVRKHINNLPVKVSKNKVSEVVENIKSETLYQGKNTNNFFLNTFTTDRWIAMGSSVVNLSKLIEGQVEMKPLAPSFFTTSKLPYEYNQSSRYEIFQSILNRVLPNIDDQKMLQCWFGYHLLETVKYGKFLILIGTGANGKSVVLKALRLFLGENNISAIPIENLSHKNRFAPAETYGKLANIYDEMSTQEPDEAFLKNYITGGQVQVERKYGHPFSFIPTAKLTFSTNVMPQFKDRSDAIWRRLSILEFKEKIQPNEQNSEYLEDQFWINSGELSGIFNWALEGAKYILNNGKLFESESSRQATHKVKMESDTTLLWIMDNITVVTGSFLNRTDVYTTFKRSMELQGQKPCPAKEFFELIRKQFPTAIPQEKNQSFGNKRSRGWLNLCSDTSDTGI